MVYISHLADTKITNLQNNATTFVFVENIIHLKERNVNDQEIKKERKRHVPEDHDE